MKLITGDTGEAHVQAADDRALRATIFGTGAYVLDAGQKFAYTIETANEITLADGELMFQGTHARIPYGDTESVTIENGTTGYNRIDLIVARYEKASGIESMTVKVIKGEPVAGTATQPEYTEGNILEGATVAEMPLYAVTISGVNVASVTPLFTVFTRQLSKLALVSELNTTNQAVSKAQSTADTAVTNAATAQATANQGVANAATAQGTANQGVALANQAQATANHGVNLANQAQSTADTAVANANAANAAAEAAMARADEKSNEAEKAAFEYTDDAVNNLQRQIDDVRSMINDLH